MNKCADVPKHLQKPKDNATRKKPRAGTLEALQEELKQVQRRPKRKAPADKGPVTPGFARNWTATQARRRKQVAELAGRGYTQSRIAEDLGICRTTVWKDLEALSDAFRESAVDDWRTWMLVVSRRLERCCDLALDGYSRSVQDAESVTETVDKSGNLTRKVKRSGQCGDPRFLELLVHASKVQADLLGLTGGPARSEGLVARGPVLVREVVISDREQATAMVRFAQLSAEHPNIQTVDGKVEASTP